MAFRLKKHEEDAVQSQIDRFIRPYVQQGLLGTRDANEVMNNVLDHVCRQSHRLRVTRNRTQDCVVSDRSARTWSITASPKLMAMFSIPSAAK